MLDGKGCSVLRRNCGPECEKFNCKIREICNKVYAAGQKSARKPPVAWVWKMVHDGVHVYKKWTCSGCGKEFQLAYKNELAALGIEHCPGCGGWIECWGEDSPAMRRTIEAMKKGMNARTESAGRRKLCNLRLRSRNAQKTVREAGLTRLLCCRFCHLFNS